MGFISRQRIASSAGTVGGGGLALAGLILGVVGFVSSVGFFLLYITGAITNSFSTPSPS